MEGLVRLLDNKILISLGGIVLLAPALPFLVLMLLGLVVAGFAFYYLVELMDDFSRKQKT